MRNTGSPSVRPEPSPRCDGETFVVAIATGRPVELIGAPGDYADWLIGSNGATVVHAETRRTILDLTVSVEEARSLAALVRAAVAGVGFSVISERDAVHEAGFERIVPPGVAAGRLAADALAHDGVAGQRVRAWAAFHAALSIDELTARIDAVVGPRLVARSLGFGAAEITEPSITKATALQSLVDHLGFGAESVWAFGDGANDHEMLEWAGRSHAMGNADSFTKAKADIEVPRGRHILRPSTDPRSERQAVRPGDTPSEPGHTLGRETPPDPQGSADTRNVTAPASPPTAGTAGVG